MNSIDNLCYVDRNYCAGWRRRCRECRADDLNKSVLSQVSGTGKVVDAIIIEKVGELAIHDRFCLF